MSSCLVILEVRLCLPPMGSGKCLPYLSIRQQHHSLTWRVTYLRMCETQQELIWELFCPGDMEAGLCVYQPNPSLIEGGSHFFTSISSWPLLKHIPSKKALGPRGMGTYYKMLFVGSYGEAGHQNNHYGTLLAPSCI